MFESLTGGFGLNLPRSPKERAGEGYSPTVMDEGRP